MDDNKNVVELFLELMNMPNEVIVKKKLGKENYLAKANLTDKERSFLSEYINDIHILYNINYPDNSEIIVLFVSIIIPERIELFYDELDGTLATESKMDLFRNSNVDKFHMNNLIHYIAQSLPYQSLIVINHKDIIQFVTTETNPNKIDDRRLTVKKSNGSELICMQKKLYDYSIISNIRNILLCSSSAFEAITNISNVINPHQYDKQMTENPLFDTSVYEYDSFFKYAHYFELKESLLDKILYCNLNTESCDSDYKEYLLNFFEYDVPIFSDDDYEGSNFTEFCKDNCKFLYEYSIEEDEYYHINAEEYVKNYIEACNKYSVELFSAVLNLKQIQEIKDSFDVEFPVNYNLDFDVDRLKELLFYWFEDNDDA